MKGTIMHKHIFEKLVQQWGLNGDEKDQLAKLVDHHHNPDLSRKALIALEHDHKTSSQEVQLAFATYQVKSVKIAMKTY